jgi:hypothetical protein
MDIDSNIWISALFWNEMKNKNYRSIIFLIFSIAQICVAQEGNLTDSVQNKKKYIPKISGVIQVHYLNEFNTNGDAIRDPDGFRILRARLTAKGDISKYISYELMVDPRAPEQGGILRDAYLELNYIKNQKIRVGQ